ncbi:hypothetical protein DUNSADRAFT_17113 [Dunaliella salina]|uniref:Uncharacterized protein n=1 Tax=Dunaliella salina TaxID=3046 RepID=A0ABQ7G2D7_DUNSA|nr:hypothetical protein DUNSADRAFT_17113 [Dunaliella salina]|eukprot:KAF5828766.1 hypothetical protein DUNSADRAFT_17113 [Dunaliella salina]
MDNPDKACADRGYTFVEADINGFIVRCKQKDLLSQDDDADWDYFDFEAENSLAAATGSLIWDASFAIIELLKPGPASLSQLLVGKRVLELGSGIGLAGLCCAAAGAHVMLTDIPSVSEGILACNVTSNVESYADAKLRMEDSDEQAFRGSRSGSSWHNSQPLGRGSCAAGSLDFTKPMAEQALHGNSPFDAEVVLAIDIVWLKVNTMLGCNQRMPIQAI